MARILVLLSIALGLAATHASAGSLVDSLDQACGKVVDNLGCTDLATAYPEALGAAVGVVVAAKGQFSNADDCKQKIKNGGSVLAQISSQVNVPGLPFDQLGQCSCSIVFASPSCSSVVTGYTQEVSDALKSFFCDLGICDQHQPPDDPEKDKADYYNANYVPHLAELQHADDVTAANVMRDVSRQCNDDWYYVLWVSDTNTEICGPFYHQFFAELGARQKIEQDQKNAELQKQADALQKAQDAATDNARKTAMNWAQIKLKQYGPQCSDVQCANAVGVLAFAYYGALATGMQKLDASNTAALVAANGQFEPLFKQAVMESAKRKLTVLAFIKPVVLTAKAAKLEAATTAIRVKLLALGIKNPDQLLARSRLNYLHPLRTRSLSGLRPIMKQ